MLFTIRDNKDLLTYELPEEDFAELVQRDLEERSAAAGHPVEARDPQTILDEEFNKPDYNNYRRHNRQDRQTSNISLESYNEYGNQTAISTMSADKAWELEQLAQAIEDVITSLPHKQALAFSLTTEEELSVTEAAEAMGVTKGAVSQLLGKVRSKVEKEISDRGLNI